MATGDWIKLHRKLLDNPIMQHDGLCRLWIYCLMRASWKDGKWLVPGTLKEMVVPRGSFITGLSSLHAALYPKRGADGKAIKRDWTPTSKTVWNWLTALEKMQCVKLENVSNRATMVSVCNYKTYQDSPDSDFQPASNRLPTAFQPASTVEERKKNTEDSFAPSAGSDWSIQIHEAAFRPLPFPELFAEVCKSHRDKSPPSRAEAAWKVRATSEPEARRILAGVVAWNKSRRFLCGIGVPTLANFLREQWYDNLPTEDEASDERHGRSVGSTGSKQLGKVRGSGEYDHLAGPESGQTARDAKAG